MSRFEEAYQKAMIAAMSFEEASKMADRLNDDVKGKGNILSAFPRSPIGLVSDEIRRSSVYVIAKKEYDEAFSKLRSFNTFFVKHFAKELAEARSRKRELRQSKA